MITQTEKDVIQAALIELEHNIRNEEKLPFIRDDKYPSLALFSIWEIYSGEVFGALEVRMKECITLSADGAQKENQRKCVEIIDSLELVEFHIVAKDDYSDSQIKLLDYVERMKNNRLLFK